MQDPLKYPKIIGEFCRRNEDGSINSTLDPLLFLQDYTEVPLMLNLILGSHSCILVLGLLKVKFLVGSKFIP
jgi:hypothetical protein